MAAGGTVGLPPPPPPPLLLLLVMMLVMPGTRGAEHCGDGEYLAEGHCCVSCPAGTYVAQHCSAPHSRGICMPCTDGVGYTAHENGLEECLSCRQCKDDQTILRPCTPTHDTECRCKQGYFCPAEDCEICHKCSTMCPEGKEIVQACNATMDLGCGLPDQGSTAHVWILVVISLVALGLLLFCLHRHLKCNKDASASKQDQHNILKRTFPIYLHCFGKEEEKSGHKLRCMGQKVETN
uniref:TNFR-Cys domain-containing protein n=1 Tax=Strigops habroptila TaxID=2489341 RepID=A0A672TTC5_STRHB